MPAIVVDTRVVADEQQLSTAEVVSDLREAAMKTDRQVIAVRRHLLLTDPEQQTVAFSWTYVHRDVQLATTTTPFNRLTTNNSYQSGR